MEKKYLRNPGGIYRNFSKGGQDKVMTQPLKIALVIPPGGYYAERWKKGSSMPSLGVCYIAGVLEKSGHTVEIIDAYVEGITLKQLLKRLKGLAPDCVGVTFTSENRFDAFDVFGEVKKAIPGVITCAGGPHATLAAEDTLANIPDIDFIIRGEGEETAVELARTLSEKKSVENISGLSYRKDGKVCHNPDRPLISDLDKLPFPAWHLVPWEKYAFTLDVPGRGELRAANMMTSRGCPFTCNFCASSKVWGRRFRMRSVDNILKEIELLRDKYRIQALWIFDDTFTVNRKRVEDFCISLLEKKWDLSWFCEIRVDTVDKELLTLMKKAGCYSVGFGVESGSQEILDKVIGKRISLEQVKNVAEICRAVGIVSNPFFIFSHPGETRDDINKTMEMINSWPKPSSISLSLLHVYPGTKLEEIAKEKGIIPRDFSWAVRSDNRVTMLPTAQGHVPIFIDKLSLSEVSEYIFKWRERQGYRLWKKIPEVILSIRSHRDILRYFDVFRGFIKYRLSSRPGHPGRKS
jgi:anaerobic magnesium-protoporphyrin IX monomethyl ester cyclase